MKVSFKSCGCYIFSEMALCSKNWVFAVCFFHQCKVVDEVLNQDVLEEKEDLKTNETKKEDLGTEVLRLWHFTAMDKCLRTIVFL